jgi:hypothetical protein
MNKQTQAINNFIEELTKDPQKIYNKLIRHSAGSGSVSNFRQEIEEYVKSKIRNQFINDGKGGHDCQYQNNNVNSFVHMNVAFDYSLVAGPRSNVKLYIPVQYNQDQHQMAMPVQKLYDFLFENKINFESKLSPRLRSDLFCLRLNNSNDALRVIEFCKKIPELHQEEISNPFLVYEQGIGMARDTHHHSYNGHIEKYLINFIKGDNLQGLDKEQYASAFLEYIKKSVVLKSNDKFIKKVIIDNLGAIINGKSLQEVLPKEIEINFDSELYNKYRRTHNGKHYVYIDSNNVEITPNSNAELYLKLQANNFMSKLFYSSYGKYPKEGFKLNPKIVREISNNLDYINDGNENYGLHATTIVLNTEDPKLLELLPYFYADVAHQHKECNLYRSMEILRLLQETTYSKQTNDNGFIYVNNKNQPIITTYPLIKTEKGTIGIQMIDNKLANIYQIKNGKIKVIENAVIELDEKIMKDENDPHYQEYRTFIAQELLDYNRTVRMINDRSGHLGVFKYNHGKNKVDKFVPESSVLSKLKALRASKLLEQVAIRDETILDEGRSL